MKRGPVVIYRCFVCSGLLSSETFYSSNNFGVPIWTDSRFCRPGEESAGEWWKCAHCGVISLAEDKEVGEIDRLTALLDPKMNPEIAAEIKSARRQIGLYKDVPGYQVPTFDDLWNLLCRGHFQTKDECSIRLMAWWRANDLRRGAESPSELSASEIANLERILELLCNAPDEWTLRAEAFRQLGRFEEARSVLEGRPDPEGGLWFSRHLMALIESRDTTLCELKREDS